MTIGALALSVSAPAQHGPYAGEQQRAIKSLSEKDIADLQAGQGMGLAKAAELNGYPGPAHVLEHADALQLTAVQREQPKSFSICTRPLRASWGGSWWRRSERWTWRLRANASAHRA
ncbi:hypothetical protein J7E62_31490 [Variovorax paradoxus]|nr:hypothetical protein [Variovorax paradoxus]